VNENSSSTGPSTCTIVYELVPNGTYKSELREFIAPEVQDRYKYHKQSSDSNQYKQSCIMFLRLLMIQMLQDKANRDNRKSRYLKRYLRRLDASRRHNRQRRIPRESLHHPSCSAWKQLYHSCNHQAFITLTGLDYNTFTWLETLFRPIHDNYSHWVSPDGKISKIKNNMGRPRLIDASDCLGLCLAWTQTRGSAMVLQMIFGLTATPLSMYLRFGRRILVKVLQSHPYSKIAIPSDELIEVYKQRIIERHPALQDVWCTMDGIKLMLQQSGNQLSQGNYYNGWTHDHYVSNVIVFCPDGTIPICYYNLPGTLHDSNVAVIGKIYDKLEDVYNRNGGKCTADSAFAAKNVPYIIKSSQSIDLEDNDIEALRNRLIVNQQATSMRQSAEWGMRALKASFPRIKDRFIYEEYGERAIILKMLLLLYNLRARKVGINQIKNVYMANLTRNANEYFVGPMLEE
jgi:DDE superfamily endonuclease